jgi:hypothetical protein
MITWGILNLIPSLLTWDSPLGGVNFNLGKGAGGSHVQSAEGDVKTSSRIGGCLGLT